jgi:hypothetical protein
MMGNGTRNSNEREVTRTAAACLALALVALASGCGSKSSSARQSASASAASPAAAAAAAAAKAFVDRADAICTQPPTGPDPGPFPFPSFDPLHPDRSKLPAIGRYFKRTNSLPMLRRELAQLKALGTPPKDQSDWQKLLAAKQSGVSATAKQYQAALATDVPTFIATVNTLTTATDDEVADARSFGATSCAPPGAEQPAGPPPRGSVISPQARPALGQLAACMRANGIAVTVNPSNQGPPLTTRVPATDPRYVAVGAKCRARLSSRFPQLAQAPTPP